MKRAKGKSTVFTETDYTTRTKCFVFFQEEYRNSMPASSFQQQKLRVCEVCSAYLGLHDNDRRLADHFGGKLHLGFIQIREKLDQLKVCVSFLDVTCGIKPKVLKEYTVN